MECDVPFSRLWADLGALPLSEGSGLPDRIRNGLYFYPCDLLFVHRDAERETRAKRVREIREALADLPVALLPTFVCVIPIRMQEAWLLIDEAAIKSAAGNRRYTGPLDLPPITDLEGIPDPKELLHRLLRQASDLSKRRQRSFPVGRRARLVTEFIEDFTPLRQLSAFVALEEEVSSAIRAKDWHL